MTETAFEVYQLKISLKSVRPPIWRRLIVPLETTNNDLHRVIMAVFNFSGGHLHEFDFTRAWGWARHDAGRGQDRDCDSS